ncbi:Theileria-specific hypothetical protein family member, putative [Theileria annulata]|uniref:Uncharacterized protein n=1 Tax=Theileria annulata TaxID=5874 RepID=Q4UDA4_THEAN|nr:Theileria-specific hypothetical protein family member, putative [Theileria annulata]CAI74935.1 Theileria-specific hypothetical protein family member, putative [Theileria annulata]|eukprot:XP_952667.1 Theileria-specific hypothetical protein family member, putative [Theileria annulata]
MSEDQEISSSVIDSHVDESNSNSPNSNDDLTIIAQNPIIIDESNSNSDNSNQGLTIIVKNPIILDESNSNSLNSSQTSTIEAQNVTIIIPESRSILPQLSLDFGVDPRYATIFAKQTHIGTNQNFSYDIHSSNDPKVKEGIEKFIIESTIDAFERLKNMPDRTDGIPNRVLDYLGGFVGFSNRTTKGSDKTTNDDAHQSENFELISVDTNDIPLDKVDVVHGDNYIIKPKKGFGISKLTEANELMWKSNNSSKYVKQFLLYNEGDKYCAFLLLNDMSLVSLERTDWSKTWEIVPNNFNFNDLIGINKNHYHDPVFEFLTDFHEHFLIIFMPYLMEKIIYKDSLVFNDNGNYPLFLSVDLLTCQIKPHLYQVKINHYLARFQLGHELSDVEKRGEEDIPVLENIGEFISSIHETNEMDEGNSSEKLTNELRDRYTNSTITIHSNSDGSSSPENQQKFETESVNNCDRNEPLIKYVELDINERLSEFIRQSYKDSTFYKSPKHTLFDKVTDDKKVIWKKKKNRLLAKEVYFYFDDNVKWVIILLKNNTLKFYHKPSDTREWTDVSTKMLSTDILKVINKNSGKQSRMDFNFDFFSSFCLIDLGNAVSVGYKDYVQYFKEFGIEHSVWLLFDVLTKSVYFIEFILKTQNQLTNQH